MFQHGYLDEAAASFQQVVATKPNDPRGTTIWERLSLQRHEYSQARSILTGVEIAAELSGSVETTWE